MSGSNTGLGVAAPRSVPPPHAASNYSGVNLTSRLEEAAHARSSLENARVENESLANRVKELERIVKELRRNKEGGREESEDQRGRRGVRGSNGETGEVGVRNVGSALAEGGGDAAVGS